MEKSKIITKETLYGGLARIQQTLKAPKGQYNTFSNFTYRSCEDIVEAVKPLLNGLVLMLEDEIVIVGNRYYVKANATLTNGKEKVSVFAYAREAEIKKGMDEAQITGSASSYARKYALNGLFAIDDTKDADTKDNSPATVQGEPTKVDPTDDWPKQDEHFCKIHNKPMKQRTAKNGGHYYDHRWQTENGEWQQCNGKVKSSSQQYGKSY